MSEVSATMWVLRAAWVCPECRMPPKREQRINVRHREVDCCGWVNVPLEWDPDGVEFEVELFASWAPADRDVGLDAGFDDFRAEVDGKVFALFGDEEEPALLKLSDAHEGEVEYRTYGDE